MVASVRRTRTGCRGRAHLLRLDDGATLLPLVDDHGVEHLPHAAREALPTLPEVMASSDKVAGAVERGCADAVEAAALEDRVGEVFDAMVVDQREKGRAVVQVQEPAVLANASGEHELGTWVRVRLTEATVSTSTVRFEIVD